MALLVADSRSEKFDKPPPPKKKWIQNYLEDRGGDEDGSGDDGSGSDESIAAADSTLRLLHKAGGTGTDGSDHTSSVCGGVASGDSGECPQSLLQSGGGALPTADNRDSAMVQSVINQFQDYIHQQTNRNNILLLQQQQQQQPIVSGASTAVIYGSDRHHNSVVGAVNSAFSSPVLIQQSRRSEAEAKHKAERHMARLLDPKNGGEKFNDSLLKISHRTTAEQQQQKPAEGAVHTPEHNLSQKDIGGVVQGVISQFLNGSVADAHHARRASRKRCRKHEKCPSRSHRSSRGEGGVGTGAGASSASLHHSSNTGEPLPKYSKKDCGVAVSPPPSVTLIHTKGEHSLNLPATAPEIDNNSSDDCCGVLNLSLPKAGNSCDSSLLTDTDPHTSSRVTFAAEDSCYSTDSQRSMEISKSQQMYDADEALNLDLKSVKRQNGYHSVYYPTIDDPSRHTHHYNHHKIRSVANSNTTTNGYIKPVPLSTLIKAPVSLSPRGSPPHLPQHHQISPVASSAPVNLVVKSAADADKMKKPKVVQPPPPVAGRFPFNANKSNVMLSDKRSAAPVVGTKYSSIVSAPPSKYSSLSPKRASSISPPTVTVIKDPSSTKRSSSESSSSGESSTGSSATSRRKSNNSERAGSTSPPASAAGSSKPAAVNSSSATASTTRELHNQLEKNRRAQLKLCFEELANECQIDPKTKASNLTVIRTAYKVIMGLRRDERVNERELANLAQEKIKLTQRLEDLKRQYPGVIVQSE